MPSDLHLPMQVVIDNPQAGEYLAQVTAVAIDSSEGPQKSSVVVGRLLMHRVAAAHAHYMVVSHSLEVVHFRNHTYVCTCARVVMYAHAHV